MLVRFPLSGQVKQTNASDKEADVFYVENFNFDERGYMKLSPRMVRLYSDNDDADFGLPVAIGRQADGDYQVATDSANWQVDVSIVTKTLTEDTGTSNPEPTMDGDGVWFSGLWHVSTATAVLSRPATGGGGQAYTSRITSLTDGVRHLIRVFGNRVSLCVSNGNVVKQYTSAYDASTDLTISSDFEISGMAYNTGKMGIITRLSNDGSVGQDQEAMFYIWSGATTGANSDSGIGSDAGIGIVAYGSSFLVLTRSGELKYWNGGGFQTVAFFPFFNLEHIFGDERANNALGNVHMKVDGDVAYIHIGNEISPFGIKQDRYIENFPAGIYCFDPRVGLYHRYSLSNSPAYIYTVADSGVNTSTNVMTISSGTVPATGNTARPVQLAGIGGLTNNVNYYIIKESATTFKLATSKEYAFAGVAIDLTSATAGSNYFLMVDAKDYGTTYYNTPGALTLTGDRNMVYTDVVAGGRLNDTDITDVEALCIAVPYLENRGVIVYPKLFASNIKDIGQKFVVRFRPLGSDESIVVKVRNKDVYGLPVSTTGYGATWTGTKDLYTTQDLSEAKSYLDSGKSIEMHIISGVGAGQRVNVVSMGETSGTYSLVLEDPAIGVVAGDRCNFQLNNWEVRRTITSADNDDGYVDVPLDISAAKFVQVQVEARGYNVTIEDAYYQNTKQE